MKTVAAPIPFAGSQLRETRHVRDAVICVYDLAKFGGDTVVDIMRTHPMIIIGGILEQNPFFAPPEESLYELRERRAMQTPSPSPRL
ncbi:MAG: hypothetical protein ACLPV8_23020 [Steroidobacteraceae bacterium]